MADSGKSLKRSKDKEKQLQHKKREKKILYSTLGVAAAFTVFWLVALTTDYWAHLVLPEGGVTLNSRQHGVKMTVVVTQLYIGLWRHCRVEWTNVSSTINDLVNDDGSVQLVASVNNDSSTMAPNHAAGNSYGKRIVYEQTEHRLCSQHSFYPSSQELEDRGLDHGLLDYRRAATGMAIIGLLVAIIANTFCYYSIVRPRYIIRRLAGCMQLGTAACLVVSIEIFNGGLSYAKTFVPSIYPAETLHHEFGFSFGLAWLCFAVFLIAGIVFLVHSRKDKSADKDQPVNIGR